MLVRRRRRPTAIALLALCAAGLTLAAGCGGDDDTPEEPSQAVDDRIVRQMNEEINRAEAFERLNGAPPRVSYEKFGAPDPDHPRRTLKLFVCYRWDVIGGNPGSFAEMCFLNDKSLGSVLVSIERSRV